MKSPRLSEQFVLAVDALCELLVIDYVIYLVQLLLHDLSGTVCELDVIKLGRVVRHLERTYVDVAREPAHGARVRPGFFAANVNKAPNRLLVCDSERERSATKRLYCSWSFVQLALWEAARTHTEIGNGNQKPLEKSDDEKMAWRDQFSMRVIVTYSKRPPSSFKNVSIEAATLACASLSTPKSPFIQETHSK